MSLPAVPKEGHASPDLKLTLLQADTHHSIQRRMENIMATKRLKVDELRVGMYLNLPGSWASHPFLKNHFYIRSKRQIVRLRAHGFREVIVDLSKSPPIEDVAVQSDGLEDISHGDEAVDPRHGAVPVEWSPRDLVPPELADAMENKRLAPAEKSRAVYRHSREMMSRLLDSPTAENIQAGKQAISSIADLILADDQTSAHLMHITSHDFYTYTHSVNVGVISLMLTKELFFRSDVHDLHELGAGFFLHDLGKVSVPSEIINKPGRLTEEEMRRMRIHPYQGYKLLEAAGALTEECRVIVMQHHENSDGSGYPRHLKDDDIHLYGRICGIADVFDALTAERSYKKALKPFEALSLMKRQMSNRFDPRLFGSFVRMFEKSQRLIR